MYKAVVQKKAVSEIDSNAVYNGNLESGFIEAVSGLLANINDNDENDSGFKILLVDGEYFENINIYN